MRKILLVGLLLLVPLNGCSILQSSSTKEGSRLRPEDPNAILSLKSLKKKELVATLSKSELTNRIRPVDIFAAGTTERPEYRLFGIMPGSIYETLGLEDGDVLLSCEGRFLVTGDLFKQYVMLMPGLEKAAIEFRRGQRIYAMRYTIQ